MSELPDGIEPAEIPEPKDSALGIVVRRRRGGLEVLLGLRARKTRFMPGNLAFPGGRLEDQDERERVGAFERCASRELREETGLAIPAASWRPAGERTTPPIFPVRFRTLFFVTELPEDAQLPAAPHAPEEIESQSFAEPGAVLLEWAAGRALVPPPLLPILRYLAGADAGDAVTLAAEIAAVNSRENEAPRIEFVPGYWTLPVRTRTLPPASCTNVWIPGGRRFVVIDPGSPEPDENARLLAIIEKRARTGAAADAIVLTHHHRDHVSGLGTIAAALGVPVLAHTETLARIPSLPAGIRTRPLADGDVLDLDGMTLRAVHTPGHAPGHLAFFDDERRVLIAGDLVSGLSTILVGLADGDMDAYIDALRRAATFNPVTVLPAHGPPLPGKVLTATIAHRQEREARIVAALERASTRDLASIAEAAYAGAEDAPRFLRELQARAHLDRLVRHGVVERVGERYRRLAP